MFIFIVYFGWACYATTVLFALWKGGRAEQIAAILNLGLALVGVLLHLLLPSPWLRIGLLMADFALAAGFLLLAIRYVSPWLGLAMLLQSVQFALHAYYFVSDAPRAYLYALVNNLNSFGIMICIMIGTLMAWRSRTAAKARSRNISAA